MTAAGGADRAGAALGDASEAALAAPERGAGDLPRGVATAALGGLVLLFFAPGIFFGEVPVFRDLLVLVLPLRAYAAASIRAGRLPLWAPELFLGAPWLANYQSALLYPPSAILDLLPLPPALSLFLAFHLFVAAAGMTRFLVRRLGVERSAALLGGVVFAFGGFVASLLPLTNQLEVAAWAPWTIDAAEELAQRGGGAVFLRLTLFLVLGVLGGAPEAFLLTLVLLGARLLPALLRSETRRCAAAAGGAVILAVALGAVQLLPTLEYARATDRADVMPLASVAAESVAPRSLVQLFLPHVFDGGAPGLNADGIPLVWSLYLGVAPLLLALAAAASRRLVFWTGVFVVSAGLAAGTHLPLLPGLYAVAPRIVGAFRFPVKFFLLAHFAGSVLAAAGASRVLHRGDLPRGAAAAAGVAALGALVAVTAKTAPGALLASLGYALRPDLRGQTVAYLAAGVGLLGVRLAVLSLAFLGILRLRARGRLAPEWAVGLTALVTFAELLTVHRPPLAFTPWREIRAAIDPARLGLERSSRIFHYCTEGLGCMPDGAPGLGPWTSTIRAGEDVSERAISLAAALVPDVPLIDGFSAVAGSDGFATRDQRAFYRALALLPRERALHLLAALGVDRLVGQQPLGPALPLRFRGPSVAVHVLPDAAPRSYLAERELSAPDAGASLERVSAPDFRSGRDAVVIGSTAATAGGELLGVRFSPERVEARAILPAAGLWVVSDTWFPGWRATVDGRDAEILRVNGIVRGVRVPPGEHALVMRYEPESFRVGTAISLAAAAITLGIAAAALRGRS